MAKTRARTEAGKYISDDPSTPQNEAWVEDKPKKRRQVLKKKKVTSKDLPPVGSADRKGLFFRV